MKYLRPVDKVIMVILFVVLLYILLQIIRAGNAG